MFRLFNKTKTKKKFNKFDCATRRTLRCALRCVVWCSVVNFVVQFYLRTRENKFHVAIYPRVHFVMIYIFKFYILRIYIFELLHILVFIFCNIYSKVSGMSILLRLKRDTYENGTYFL